MEETMFEVQTRAKIKPSWISSDEEWERHWTCEFECETLERAQELAKTYRFVYQALYSVRIVEVKTTTTETIVG